MKKFKNFDSYEDDVDYDDYLYDSEMTWEEHALETVLVVPIFVFMVLLIYQVLWYLCWPFLRVRDGCESWANLYFLLFFVFYKVVY